MSTGGHDETVAHYARIRTRTVAAQLKEGRQREESRRQRQLESFKSVADLKREELPVARRAGFFPTLVDSLFWHAVAVLGIISCLVGVAALWPAFRGCFSVGSILVLAVALQAIPVTAWFTGRGFLDSMSYQQVTQVSACIAVGLSIVLGSYMLTQPDAVQSGRPIAARAPAGFVAAPSKTMAGRDADPRGRESAPREGRERLAANQRP